MIDQFVYTNWHNVDLYTGVYSCPEILIPSMMLFSPVSNVCNQMSELGNLVCLAMLFPYSHLKTKGIFAGANI